MDDDLRAVNGLDRGFGTHHERDKIHPPPDVNVTKRSVKSHAIGEAMLIATTVERRRRITAVGKETTISAVTGRIETGTITP